MKEKVAITLTVFFPGVGQLLLGRLLNGFFLFSAYTFFFLLGIFRLIVSDARSVFDDRWFCLAVGAGAAAWCCALVETLQFSLQRKSRGTQEERDRHVRDGVVAYLKGEFGQAVAQFQQALALDRTDGDARFHLAMALKAQGARRKAKRVLKQCLAFDPDTKWYSEIRDELEEL